MHDPAPAPHEPSFAPPVPPMWLTVVWALSPAVVILAAAKIFGLDWPYLTWAAYITGGVSMMIFALWQLWSRRVEGFEFKAIPLGLAMLIFNGLLVIAGSWIFGIPFGK